MGNMRKEQHMPFTMGPWEVIGEKTGNDNFHDSIYAGGFKGLLIARCNQNGEYPDDSNLISAAPDLLEALEEIMKHPTGYMEPYMIDGRDRAIAALKKARGE